jgi:peptidoglycan hydrolase-like protein with peptidoglycan-binding domain
MRNSCRLWRPSLHNGFPVAKSGPGFTGNETDIFGPHTYAALIKFQQEHGLPATGFFGPLTRLVLNGASTTEATSTAQ